VSAGLRRKILRRVFDILDADDDNVVCFTEIRLWLDSESSWRTFMNDASDDPKMFKRIKEQVIRDMDQSGRDGITFHEMERYFSNWPLRQIRVFTQDATHLEVLEAFTRNPTATNRDALFKSQADRSYAATVYDEHKVAADRIKARQLSLQGNLSPTSSFM